MGLELTTDGVLVTRVTHYPLRHTAPKMCLDDVKVVGGSICKKMC